MTLEMLYVFQSQGLMVTIIYCWFTNKWKYTDAEEQAERAVHVAYFYFFKIVWLLVLFHKWRPNWMRKAWKNIVQHTLMVTHILICRRKVDLVFLFLKSFYWYALNLSTLLVLLSNSTEVSTFAYTELRVLPPRATSFFLVTPTIVPFIPLSFHFVLIFDSFNYYFRLYRNEHGWNHPQRDDLFCCAGLHPLNFRKV